MFGLSNLTAVKGVKHQFLWGHNTQQCWTVPKNTSALFILTVGGGGGGGAGESATGICGGGGGGAVGTAATALVPSIFLPRNLFIYIGKGGQGGATGTGQTGGSTVVTTGDFNWVGTSSICGAFGGNGGQTYAFGNGGNGGTYQVNYPPWHGENCYAGFGIAQTLPSGTAGGAGGNYNGAASNSYMGYGRPFSGGGGGGGAEIGVQEHNGGTVSSGDFGLNLPSTVIPGGTSTNRNGSPGMWTTKPFIMTGGGGGAGNSTASAIGGKGGKGAPGCGGGGGGGAPTGGAGGDGGDGFVLLVWW